MASRKGGYSLRSQSLAPAGNLVESEVSVPAAVSGSSLLHTKMYPLGRETPVPLQVDIASNASSSKSRRLKERELEQQTTEQLNELDEREFQLNKTTKLLETGIRKLEEKLLKKKKTLEDLQPGENSSDLPVEIGFLEEELQNKKDELEYQNIETDFQKGSIERKRKLILDKKEVQNMAIEEEFDNGNDFEESNSQDFDFACSRDKIQAIDLFVKEASEHAERTEDIENKRKEAESEAERLIQKQRNEATAKAFEALDKAKIEAFEMNQKAAEASKDAAEANKKQTEMQEEVVKLTKNEALSIPCNSQASEHVMTPSIADQMGLAIANAIRSSTQDKSLDNNKFLARQSHAKDLPFFSGNPDEWLKFKYAFERTTNICGFKDDENLERLERRLKGEAMDAVKGLMTTPENVPSIMKKLEMRFGQPEFIIKAMTQKVMELTPIKENQFESIIEFGNAVDGLTRTLESLGRNDHLKNPMLLEAMESKLTPNYKINWREWIGMNPGKDKDVSSFAQWLEKKMEVVCALCPPTTNSKVRKDDKPQGDRHQWNKNNLRNRRQGEHAMVVDSDRDPENREHSRKDKTEDTVKKRKCQFCSKTGHRIHNCREFKALDVSARNKHVEVKKLCYSCLNYGHRTKDCQGAKKCGKDGCNGTHNFLLHRNRIPEGHKQEKKLENVNLAEEVDEREEDVGFAIPTNTVKEESFPISKLRILPIKVKGPNGYLEKYVMMDPGSTVSLITKQLAMEMKLTGKSIQLKLTGINKPGPAQEAKEVDFEIYTKDKKGPFQISGACTVDRLPIPAQTITPEFQGKWKHLKGIDLAYFENGKPDILIGQDHADLICAYEVRSGSAKSPVAIRTPLGWILSGRKSGWVRDENSYHIRDENNFHIRGDSPEDSLQELQQLVKQHMAVDNIGIKICHVKTRSKEDELSQVLMNRDMKKVGERWEAGLLWKKCDTKQPDGYQQALVRLKQMERKMDRNPDFSQKYNSKIEEYLKKGFARKLTREEVEAGGERTYYIPHFMAFNPKKENPYRFVFDCAAKIDGISLNDRLMTGPDKLIPLPVILYALREKKYAITGDVQDMFHRIKIKDKDAEAQRFLFRGSERKRTPDVYQMEVLIFGATCSPTLAQKTKNRNALQFKKTYPEAVNTIINNFYVDDYGNSFDTIEEAVKNQKEVTLINQKGGFKVHKWRSNSSDVIKYIPKDMRAPAKEVKNLDCDPGEETERILGLFWRPIEDHFTFALNYLKAPQEVIEGIRIPTKRELLALVISIYDPLGFIANFTIKGKIILQDTWRMKTDWNEELPEIVHWKWKVWLKELKEISTFKLSRCYSEKLSTADEVQLHVFGDASEQAYGAIAYLRIKNGDNIDTALIAAKSKVAPLKAISMPRSELQAALIASRLAKSIKEMHRIKIHRTVYWTDSEVVFAWVRSDGKRFPQFIANRVGEIQELTDALEWKWLPGKDNVADELTRDKTACDWSPNSRWINGPFFLFVDEEEWPKEKPPKVKDEVFEEKKEQIYLADKTALVHIDVNKYSKWNTLVRVTSYVLRFIANCRKSRKKTVKINWELFPEEIQKADNWWWKQSQHQSFLEELECLEKRKDQHHAKVDKSSKLWKLNPFVDEDGVLRVAGRLQKGKDIPFEMKYPIILHAKHPYTRLLINHYHIKCGHHGNERIVNDLKQRFYILNCRNAVRSAKYSCQYCSNNRVEPIVPEMGQLPNYRLDSSGPAFKNTGLDYFGPITVTVGRSRQKRYVALFTCMASRAVHLEMTNSLSTDACILAIKRFVARRGCPRNIYSDNGTNFVGANNELINSMEEINQNKMIGACTTEGIRWHFNPPGAPHIGGVWERLVRSVKVALYAIMKEQFPREEVFATFLIEAENVVNSHPLYDVSSDLDDREALTPNDILRPQNKMEPIVILGEGDKASRQLWRRAEDLADQFWGRWRREYLPTLLNSPKWQQAGKKIEVGDIVLIVDKSMHRGSWPKGKVIKVFPGKDGMIRVAEVQTSKGIYTRPVAKLAVLDVRKINILVEEKSQEKVVAVVTRAAAKMITEKQKQVPEEIQIRKVNLELSLKKAKQLGLLTMRQEIQISKDSGWYKAVMEDYKKSFKARQKKAKEDSQRDIEGVSD